MLRNIKNKGKNLNKIIDNHIKSKINAKQKNKLALTKQMISTYKKTTKTN